MAEEKKECCSEKNHCCTSKKFIIGLLAGALLTVLAVGVSKATFCKGMTCPLNKSVQIQQ